jgi:hypothetical protein
MDELGLDRLFVYPYSTEAPTYGCWVCEDPACWQREDVPTGSVLCPKHDEDWKATVGFKEQTILQFKRWCWEHRDQSRFGAPNNRPNIWTPYE